MRTTSKSKIFAACISALQAGELEACAKLLDQLAIDEISEPAAASLRSWLIRSLQEAGSSPIAARPQLDKTATAIGPRAHQIEGTQHFRIPAPPPNLADKAVMAIVTPVFNAAPFIEDTLASVLMQKGDFVLRYHVQDGNSTDGTTRILDRWMRLAQEGHFGDRDRIRFTWSSESDSGMYDAIARGFRRLDSELRVEQARRTIMTWLNADDILGAHALRTVAEYFESNPDAHWITGYGSLMNEQGSVGRTFHDPETFGQRNIALGLHDGRSLPFIQQEGTFWRRSLWMQTGGLDSARFLLAGDWDLWRRFAAETPLMKLHAVLGIHRRRAGQLSANADAYYAEVDSAEPLSAYSRSIAPSGYWAKLGADMQQWYTHEVKDHAPTPAAGSTSNGTEDAKIAIGALEMANTSAARSGTLPSGMPWPKISVITPSFNQGKYIAETIESVISQNYPNVEHIVIDGGSTDETLQVLDRYRAHLSHVVSEKDRGQSDALNKGFEKATGEIFCWLNSDDQFAPDALFLVAMAFDTSGADIVSGICEVYQDGKVVHRHMSACEDGVLPLHDLLDLDTGWNTGQFFYQPEVFFTRDLWQRAGRHVREDCFYSMDYELWCRFAHEGARIHVVGSPLAHFRMHPEQKTADPSKFKAELVSVRDRFAKERGIEIPASARPAANWERRLRVAMVNDIGFRYGAGIAHNRIAAGIDMAGHDLEVFELTKWKVADGGVDADSFLASVDAFHPDLIIFGNLHAADREATDIIERLGARYPGYFVTHDFWLFTGRCAYTNGCTNYLSSCDETCRTAEQYPSLPLKRIRPAWEAKQRLLASSSAPIILGNSSWSASVVRDLRSARGLEHLVVDQIQLGVPAGVFRPAPKDSARLALGIDPRHFVLAFSVSALDDERKGGQLLLDALRGLNVQGVTLLLIGQADELPNLEGVHLMPLGYVSDATTLVHALSAADVYVGPSSEETFGQVFVEAAMVGTASIGFDQTGVIDAIRDGVTGLRVKRSVQDLRNAVLQLYSDRQYCAQLGRWAALHARNSYSIESCYRSLFQVWRRQGLIDQIGLPHRVGFVRRTVLIDDGDGELVSWVPGRGMSAPEGPHLPDIPTTFRWCHGPESTLKINFKKSGSHVLKIGYHSPIFEELLVAADIEGSSAGAVAVQRTEPGLAKNLEIFCSIKKPGWSTLTLRPNKRRDAEGGERRELSFMFVDVEAINIGGDT